MGTKADIEERLRQAILDADMSRYRLSILSGVAEAVLSRFVNRSRTITIKTAAKLAAVLDLQLVSGEQAKKGG